MPVQEDVRRPPRRNKETRLVGHEQHRWRVAGRQEVLLLTTGMATPIGTARAPECTVFLCGCPPQSPAARVLERSALSPRVDDG